MMFLWHQLLHLLLAHKGVGIEGSNYVTFWAACMADVAKLIIDLKAKATSSALVFLSRKSPSILLLTCQKKIFSLISDLWLIHSIQNIVISASLIKCFRSPPCQFCSSLSYPTCIICCWGVSGVSADILGKGWFLSQKDRICIFLSSF